MDKKNFESMNNDSFDQLLESFISCELDTTQPTETITTHDNDKYVWHEGRRVKITDTPYRTICYKNCLYHVPCPRDTCYPIHSLDMTFGNDTQETYLKDALYFNENAGSNFSASFAIDLDSIYDKESGQYLTPHSVTASVFRQGIAHAIATCKCSYESTFNTDFNDKESRLPAGSYLFVIGGAQCEGSEMESQKGCIIYPFHIQSAEYVQPEFSQVVIKHNANLHATTQHIEIELSLDKATHDHSLYHIACFDSTFYLIGQSDFFVTPKQKGETIGFQLKPELFWLGSETYTVILSRDETVIALLRFSAAAPDKCRILPADSDNGIYRAAMLMKQKRPALLHRLSIDPNLSDIRRQLLLLHLQHCFYQNLPSEGIAAPRYNANNLVVINDTGSSFGFARSIFNWLSDYELYEYDPCSIDSSEATDFNTIFNYKVYGTVVVKNVSALTPTCIAKMRQYMTDFGNIILCGNSREINAFFSSHPEMLPAFEQSPELKVVFPTAKDLLYCIRHQLKFTSGLTPDDSAIKALYDNITDSYNKGMLKHASRDDMKNYIADTIVKSMRKRLLSLPTDEMKAHPEMLKTVLAADISNAYFTAKNSDYDCSIASLMHLTGLESVKKSIRLLSAQIQFNNKRMSIGLPSTANGSHHMIFTGNPGTGKTTVAKLIGKIFRSLGLLSKGNVITTERSLLIGRYIGETEDNMRKLLHEAQGNVLFIDEAYTLCDTDNDRKDFGNHVIESLLTVLSNESSDMLIIFAGYEHEIERMMEANIGLKGRFPHKLHFDDYDARQLMQIGCDYLQQQGYNLSTEAHSLLQRIIDAAISNKDRYFSNARWIKQLIANDILPIMAQRVIESPERCDAAFYATIEEEDIAQAIKLQQTSITMKTPQPIGFRA